MISVSNAFREKLEAGEPVRMVVDITFPDGTKKTIDEEIMNGDNGFTDCAESSSFPVGTSVCKTLTLNINNYEEQWKEYEFYSAKIHAYLKINSLAEKIDKGIYTVTTPEKYSDIITITALDDMYKANKAYTSGLKLPQSLINLVRDACETIGIGMNLTMSHGDIIIRSIPDNMTFRQLFGYAAMVESANARIDYSGNLGFIKWDFEKADIPDLKNYGNPPVLSSDDIIITGIRVKNGQSNDDTDSEYSGMYGKEGYLLELENELIDSDQLETVASIIGEQIVGARFRNLEGDLVYNPLVEFGDMVYTYDRLGNKYLTPLTDVSGNVGGLTTVKTQADDPIRGSSDYYSEGTKAIVAARQMVKKETSAREEAVKRLEQKISDTNASGMFCTDVRQEDGSTIRYLHDKPTLKESSNVIKVTSEAIGISNDGGKTYPYGITLDGETITRLLYAEGINADYINAGTILVKDKDKNVIFEADMDAGSVYISGNVQIGGGKTLDETLKEFSASAKNMTIQLSNEYQGIPVDSDGNYSSFPECSTQATVMYGAQDITENCSYTITESQNVSGSWDEVEHAYTVESLTADSGWIDIRATYLENLSVSKRFTIAKQYAGEQGTAGRTYFINADADILLMGADKKITPNILNLRPYYRDGQEDAKNFYAWWAIEKSVDNGSSWEDISTYSTSMKLIQIQLNTLSLEAHDMIRASAYADKEKTILCDQQTFPVALDVSALSQKDIVEILSNNGAWKGLYYLNNELYVSFNAALGGTLTLGGQNNGNGLLILLDDEGSEIGRMSSGGMSFRNSDNNIVIRINKSGMFFYDSTGQKRKVLTNSSGITIYTDYTDANNWKAIKIGKYGIYAAEKSGGVEDLWMEGDTSHQWDGYILRFLNGAVRLNANAVYTDGCSMGKNLTTSGTLTWYDYEQQSLDNPTAKRQPVASLGTDTNKVAYLATQYTTTQSPTTANSYYRLAVRGQWGNSGYSTHYIYTDLITSDIRLKKNIKNSKIKALEAVELMQVRQFDWKKGGHQNIGFVADELEEIDPNLALGGGYDENGDMDVKKINTPYLLNYAIKAIQELSVTVKEQSCKIRELEGKLDGIKGN